MLTIIVILFSSLVFATLCIGAASMAHHAEGPMDVQRAHSAPVIIINDLARTGALQCPRPAVSNSQLSTQNPLN